MKYIKQLDSLRAIAVILVIISHWITTNSLISSIPFGPIGVDIFFVLSGFLISKILFDHRNNSELSNIPKSIVLKNFYVRRTLRIFPIYYLLIFIMLVFAESTGTHIRYNFVYFLTYSSNFYFFYTQQWDGILSHLWSLAVEEQFYLIWPWIILFANKKYLFPIIIVFILIGTLSQYLLTGVPMGDALTFTCFDAFGFGAILSWIITFASEKLEKFYKIISCISIVFLLLFLLSLVQHECLYIPFRTLVSFMAMWVIAYIILNYEANSLKFKFILNNRILIFLGKISYGMYLYHEIVPNVLNLKIINVYLNPLLPDVLYKTHWEQLYLIENCILLILVSWLSYTFIEKRFLSLKKYFNYENPNNTKKTGTFSGGINL